MKGNNPLILWGFRADLKAFQLTAKKKEGGGGGGAEKKTEGKRSMAKETGNSPLAPSFPYFPFPFDVCNSDQFCSIEIPTVFCLF